jgi:hypothetical protein
MLSQAILGHLKSKHGWSRDFAQKIYPYYLSTLRRLAAGRPAAVLAAVDEMWHAHILSTREYHRFCEQEFGRYVHHVYGSGEPPAAAIDWRTQFAEDGLDPDALLAACTRCAAANVDAAQCTEEEIEPGGPRQRLSVSPGPEEGNVFPDALTLAGLAPVQCTETPTPPTLPSILPALQREAAATS